MLFLVVLPLFITSASICLCTTLCNRCEASSTQLDNKLAFQLEINNININEDSAFGIFLDTVTDPPSIPMHKFGGCSIQIYGNDENENLISLDFSTFASSQTVGSLQASNVRVAFSKETNSAVNQINFQNLYIYKNVFVQTASFDLSISNELDTTIENMNSIQKVDILTDAILKIYTNSISDLTFDDNSLCIDTNPKLVDLKIRTKIYFLVEGTVSPLNVVKITSSTTTDCQREVFLSTKSELNLDFGPISGINNIVVENQQLCRINSVTNDFQITFKTAKVVMPLSSKRKLDSFIFSDPLVSSLYLIDDNVNHISFSSASSAQLSTGNLGDDVFIDLSKSMTFLELNLNNDYLYTVEGEKTSTTEKLTLVLTKRDNYFQINNDERNSLIFDTSLIDCNVYYSSSDSVLIKDVISTASSPNINNFIYVSTSSICISPNVLTDCTTEESKFDDFSKFNKGISHILKPNSITVSTFSINNFMISNNNQILEFPLNLLAGSTNPITFSIKGKGSSSMPIKLFTTNLNNENYGNLDIKITASHVLFGGLSPPPPPIGSVGLSATFSSFSFDEDSIIRSFSSSSTGISNNDLIITKDLICKMNNLKNVDSNLFQIYGKLELNYISSNANLNNFLKINEDHLAIGSTLPPLSNLCFYIIPNLIKINIEISSISLAAEKEMTLTLKSTLSALSASTSKFSYPINLGYNSINKVSLIIDDSSNNEGFNSNTNSFPLYMKSSILTDITVSTTSTIGNSLHFDLKFFQNVKVFMDFYTKKVLNLLSFDNSLNNELHLQVSNKLPAFSSLNKIVASSSNNVLTLFCLDLNNNNNIKESFTVDISLSKVFISLPTSNSLMTIEGTPLGNNNNNKLYLLFNDQVSHLVLMNDVSSYISIQKSTLLPSLITKITVFFESTSKDHGENLNENNVDILMRWVSRSINCIYNDDTTKTQCLIKTNSIFKYDEFNSMQPFNFISNNYKLLIYSNDNNNINFYLTGKMNNMKLSLEGTSYSQSTQITFINSNNIYYGNYDGTASFNLIKTRVTFDSTINVDSLTTIGDTSSSLFLGTNMINCNTFSGVVSEYFNPNSLIGVNKKCILNVPSEYTKISTSNTNQINFIDIVNSKSCPFHVNGLNVIFEITYINSLPSPEIVVSIDFSSSSNSYSVGLIFYCTIDSFVFNFDQSHHSGIDKVDIIPINGITLTNPTTFIKPPSTFLLENDKSLVLFDDIDSFPIKIINSDFNVVFKNMMSSSRYSFKDNFPTSHDIIFEFESMTCSLNLVLGNDCFISPRFMIKTQADSFFTLSNVNNLNINNNNKPIVGFPNPSTLLLSFGNYKKIRLDSLDPLTVLKILNNNNNEYSTINCLGIKLLRIYTFNDLTKYEDISFTKEIIVENPFSELTSFFVLGVNGPVSIFNKIANSKIDFSLAPSSFDEKLITLMANPPIGGNPNNIYLVVDKQKTFQFIFDPNLNIKLIVFNINCVCLCDDTQDSECTIFINNANLNKLGSIIHSTDHFNKALPIKTMYPSSNSKRQFKLYNLLQSTTDLPVISSSLIGNNNQLYIESNLNDYDNYDPITDSCTVIVDLNDENSIINELKIVSASVQIKNSNNNLNNYNIKTLISDEKCPSITTSSSDAIFINVNEIQCFDSFIDTPKVIFKVSSILNLHLNKNNLLNLNERDSFTFQKGTSLSVSSSNLLQFDPINCISTFIPILPADVDLIIAQTSLTKNSDIGKIVINAQFPEMKLLFKNFNNGLSNGINKILINGPTLNGVTDLISIMSFSAIIECNSEIPVKFAENSLIKMSFSTFCSLSDIALSTVGNNGYLTISNSYPLVVDTVPTPSKEQINYIEILSDKIILKNKVLTTKEAYRTSNSGTLILDFDPTISPPSSDIISMNNLNARYGTSVKLGIILSNKNGNNFGLDFNSNKWKNYPMQPNSLTITTNPKNQKFYAYVNGENGNDLVSGLTIQSGNMIIFNVDNVCLCDQYNNNKQMCFTEEYCGSSVEFKGSILNSVSEFTNKKMISTNFVLINALKNNDNNNKKLSILINGFNNFTVISKAKICTLEIDITNCKSTNNLLFVDSSVSFVSSSSPIQVNPLNSLTFIGECEIIASGVNIPVNANDVNIDFNIIPSTTQITANNNLWIKRMEKCQTIAIGEKSVSFQSKRILFNLNCLLEFDANEFVISADTDIDPISSNLPKKIKILSEYSGEIIFSDKFELLANNVKTKSLFEIEALKEYVKFTSTSHLPFEYVDGSLIKMTFSTMKAAGNPLVGKDGKFYIANDDKAIQAIHLSSQSIEFSGAIASDVSTTFKLLVDQYMKSGEVFIENSFSEMESFSISFEPNSIIFPSLTLVATVPYSRIKPVSSSTSTSSIVLFFKNVISLNHNNDISIINNGKITVVIDSDIKDIHSYFMKKSNIIDVIQFHPFTACLCSETTPSACQTNEKCGKDFEGSIFYSIGEWNSISKTKYEVEQFEFVHAYTIVDEKPLFYLKCLLPTKVNINIFSTLKIMSNNNFDNDEAIFDLSMKGINFDSNSVIGPSLILDNVVAAMTSSGSGAAKEIMLFNRLEVYKSSLILSKKSISNTEILIKIKNNLKLDDTSILSNSLSFYSENKVEVEISQNNLTYYFGSDYFIDTHMTKIIVSKETSKIMFSNSNPTTKSLVLQSEITSKKQSNTFNKLSTLSSYTIGLNLNDFDSLRIVGDWSSFKNKSISITSSFSASSSASLASSMKSTLSENPLMLINISLPSAPVCFVGPSFPRMTFKSLANMREIGSVDKTGVLTIAHSTVKSVNITDNSTFLSELKSFNGDKDKDGFVTPKNTIEILKDILEGKLVIENGSPYPNYMSVFFGGSTESSKPTIASKNSVTFLTTANEAAFLLDSDDWTFCKYPKSLLSFTKDQRNPDVKKTIFMNNNADIQDNFAVAEDLAVENRPNPSNDPPTKTPSKATIAAVVGVTVGFVIVILLAVIAVVVIILRKSMRKNKIHDDGEEEGRKKKDNDDDDSNELDGIGNNKDNYKKKSLKKESKMFNDEDNNNGDEESNNVRDDETTTNDSKMKSQKEKKKREKINLEDFWNLSD